MNNGWNETKFAQALLFANPGADFYKFSTKRVFIQSAFVHK